LFIFIYFFGLSRFEANKFFAFPQAFSPALDARHLATTLVDVCRAACDCVFEALGAVGKTPKPGVA